MRDLQGDVRNANAKYRQFLMELEPKAAREAAAINREEEVPHSLRKRWGFD